VPDLKAAHAFVDGDVQGVGFRQAARSAARSLRLVGWVRNVFVQGEPAAVDEMLAWLWVGPRMAKVSGVESEVVALDQYLKDFLIRQ
jgi:acylphosphatase